MGKMASKPGSSTDRETKPADPSAKEETVKTVLYPAYNTSDDILTKLYSTRTSGEFCDVQLQISASKIVQAHKSLLAVNSPYFEGMFSSSFLEATSTVVDLSHMCDRPDVLEKVIDTFYGRSFEVNAENVGVILNLAKMLLLEDLLQQCIKVLHGILCLSNSVEMLQLSIIYDIDDLREKVVPIIKARFHDYILHQDDMNELSVEGFQCLIDTIDTSFIACREKYIHCIIKWFNICESEERACLLIKAISNIKFKLTKHSYVEYKDQLEDLLNHLDNVNTDISDDTRTDLKSALLNLKPNDYVENYPLSDESGDSDVEMEPSFVMFLDPPPEMERQYFGPPTKEKGFTEEEEEMWKKAHKKMDEREENRRLAELWPPSTRKDPNRPKGIRYESPVPVHKTRTFENSSDDHIDEMVDAVVVLAPSTEYLMKLNTSASKDPSDEDMLVVSAYIPCKKAWFKIADLSVTSIVKAFGRSSGMSSGMFDYYGMDPVDEDDFMMSMIMDTHHSRYAYKEMIRSGMSSRMFRHMMEMEPDMLMMRPEMRFRRCGQRGMPLEHFLSFIKVPPLSDKKWKVQYFQHKLFFCQDEIPQHVYCFDLFTREWSKSSIKYNSNRDDRGREYFEKLDGLELIVMKETLYVVLRVVLLDSRHEIPSRRLEDRVEEAKKQTLKVKHVVYKLTIITGEKTEMTWSEEMVTKPQYEYIDVDKKHQIVREDQDMYYMGPHLKQPNCVRTELFAEDPQKLNILHLANRHHRRDDSFSCRAVSHIQVLYLDLKEEEELRGNTSYDIFTGTVMPLISSEYTALVNDKLEMIAMIDTMRADQERSWSYSSPEDPSRSEMEEALESYPKCSSVMCSAKDGKRLWLLRGGDNDTSELIEATATFYRKGYVSRKSKINQKHHVPPPFKCFTLASTGRMYLSTIKGFGLPIKYMH